MKRVVLTADNDQAAQSLDQLVQRFVGDLAVRSSECVFYMSDPSSDRPARIIETESQETLDRFMAQVSPDISCMEA